MAPCRVLIYDWLRIPYGYRFTSDKTRHHRFSNEWTMMRRIFALMIIMACWPSGQLNAGDLNDYPTTARADYVFGCMKANGDTRLALEHCSCSIDVIASILPYERYVAAETVASINQQAGQLGSLMRNTGSVRDTLDELRRAQAEAQVRCF